MLIYFHQNLHLSSENGIRTYGPKLSKKLLHPLKRNKWVSNTQKSKKRLDLKVFLAFLGDTSFVYIVKDNVVKKKIIETGKRNFGKVSVLSGVNKGDQVISEGITKVRDKAKVKILKPNNK